MKIDKIILFEKRNNLRINVFSIEETSIYPLYASSNRTNEDIKLINLYLSVKKMAIITIHTSKTLID